MADPMTNLSAIRLASRRNTLMLLRPTLPPGPEFRIILYHAAALAAARKFTSESSQSVKSSRVPPQFLTSWRKAG